MNAVEITMLIGGIASLLVLLGLLVFCVVKRRPYKSLFVIFPVAIIMIGFPYLRSFKLMGAEVELQNTLNAAGQNPNDKQSVSQLAAALSKVEGLVTTNDATPEVAEQIARSNEILGKSDQALKWAGVALEKSPNSKTAQEVFSRIRIQRLIPADQSKPVSAQAQANLHNEISQFSQQPNLSPESRLILSKAQLVLGHTNEAITNLQHVMRANTNLIIDPRLRILLTK